MAGGEGDFNPVVVSICSASRGSPSVAGERKAGGVVVLSVVRTGKSIAGAEEAKVAHPHPVDVSRHPGVDSKTNGSAGGGNRRGLRADRMTHAGGHAAREIQRSQRDGLFGVKRGLEASEQRGAVGEDTVEVDAGQVGTGLVGGGEVVPGVRGHIGVGPQGGVTRSPGDRSVGLEVKEETASALVSEREDFPAVGVGADPTHDGEAVVTHGQFG